MHPVAHALRARRRALGLTQEDVAVLAGVSTRWLRKVEQGENVRLHEVLRVLDVLGLALRVEPLEDA